MHKAKNIYFLHIKKKKKKRDGPRGWPKAGYLPILFSEFSSNFEVLALKFLLKLYSLVIVRSMIQKLFDNNVKSYYKNISKNPEF